MIRLPKPAIAPIDVFSACLAHVNHRLPEADVSAAQTNYAVNVARYNDLGSSHQLSNYGSSVSIGKVTDDHHMATYKNHFRGKSERQFYDEIKNSSPRNLCPYCGARFVGEIDHYLPDCAYPELAVMVFNLLPACKPCNFEKLAFDPSSPTEELFHPYYDDWDGTPFLEASVYVDFPLTISFSVNHSMAAPVDSFARYEHHMNFLHLFDLYRMNADLELGSRREYFVKTYEEDGPAELKRDLDRDAQARLSFGTNSWQAALYRALAASPAFLAGGFYNIDS